MAGLGDSKSGFGNEDLLPNGWMESRAPAPLWARGGGVKVGAVSYLAGA